MSRIVARIKSGKDISLRNRHPWVFSGALEKVDPSWKEGQLVEVRSASGEFLGLGHYYPGGSIAVKVCCFSPGVSESDHVNQALRRAWRMREKCGLTNSKDTNCYRWVFGEADELPGLIVDVYGSVVVVQFQAAGSLGWKDAVVEAAQEVLKGRLQGVFARYPQEKDVSSIDSEPSSHPPTGEYIFGGPDLGPVRENGVIYKVDWEKGQKTGFFLDQRDNRALVRKYALGAQVLDAFCYTGGFSMAALVGGAERVTAVDISGKSIALVQENAQLNQVSQRLNAEEADCFKYLEKVADKFDLIVLDPPAFVKHRKALSRGLRGYESINYQAIRALQRGGLLFTFSCSQLVSREEFRKRVFIAASQARRMVRVLAELGQPVCHPVSIYHPEGAYLKGLLLHVD